MGLSMVSLLMHSDQVSAKARDAIRAAYEAPAEHRGARLESAARILHQETDLECSEVLELVGLPGEGDCA